MINRNHSPLHEEPLSQTAPVIPPQQDESILDWLQRTGRLVPRTSVEYADEQETEEELQEIIGTGDSYEFEQEEEDNLEI
ncbi:MAG: DUF3134 family protein [Nostocaceae cyanobacterium]|nr:DUF3134 family protein [Nostocaceae cyanobacterium]